MIIDFSLSIEDGAATKSSEVSGDVSMYITKGEKNAQIWHGSGKVVIQYTVDCSFVNIIMYITALLLYFIS